MRRGKQFGALHNPSHDDRPIRAAVLDYLNHYEIVAIGIRQNILDSRIYQEWLRGVVIRDWNEAADFIQRERWKENRAGVWSYNPRIYGNYQALARS